jgi:endonuclease YncB( thermonuclease family)
MDAMRTLSNLQKFTFTAVLLLSSLIAWLLPKDSPYEQPPSPYAQPHSLDPNLAGRILSVADGDTFTLDVNGQKVKVRLYGIDCPERDQPYGKEARDFVLDWVRGRPVSIKSRGKDQYERVLGEAFIGESNLNKELLAHGYAWWYESHAKTRKDYRELQQQAQQARRGLWSDPEPITPWEFRRIYQ